MPYAALFFMTNFDRTSRPVKTAQVNRLLRRLIISMVLFCKDLFFSQKY